jgi:tetratricopeptide (TPR) repeat protein
LDASGFRDNGLEFLNMALEIEGSGAKQLQWRGRIYMILGQYEAATRVLSSSVEKGNEEANIYLAQAYKDSGDVEKSKEILSAFAEKQNASASGLLVLGDLYMEDGQYEQAFETYESALSLEDDTYKKQILKNEIGALEYLGRYQEALEKANIYITEYPADTDVLREITFLGTRV